MMSPLESAAESFAADALLLEAGTIAASVAERSRASFTPLPEPGNTCSTKATNRSISDEPSSAARAPRIRMIRPSKSFSETSNGPSIGERTSESKRGASSG